jgi:hypothetical protein
LKDLGVPKVTIDEYGYVMATIPANVQKNVPAVGFIAHVDTSPEVSGANVKPQIVTNYKGGDIVLSGDPTVVIRESENPALKAAFGKMIVTSDGTTLFNHSLIIQKSCMGILKLVLRRMKRSAQERSSSTSKSSALNLPTRSMVTPRAN